MPSHNPSVVVVFHFPSAPFYFEAVVGLVRLVIHLFFLIRSSSWSEGELISRRRRESHCRLSSSRRRRLSGWDGGCRRRGRWWWWRGWWWSRRWWRFVAWLRLCGCVIEKELDCESRLIAVRRYVSELVFGRCSWEEAVSWGTYWYSQYTECNWYSHLVR